MSMLAAQGGPFLEKDEGYVYLVHGILDGKAQHRGTYVKNIPRFFRRPPHQIACSVEDQQSFNNEALFSSHIIRHFLFYIVV